MAILVALGFVGVISAIQKNRAGGGWFKLHRKPSLGEFVEFQGTTKGYRARRRMEKAVW